MEAFDGAIGIDLGTTYSCVGVWKDGRIEIIANDQGNRTTPSCVAFLKDSATSRLVGDGAKNQAASNPKNTVFDAKRLIGRKFSDENVQRDKASWPFTVVQAEGGKPVVEIETAGVKRTYSAEEVSAMILRKMKRIAESYLGKSVRDAVVTVPAYFNDAQRQSTKDAGEIAGLNVLRIINEPTAAAIAYGLSSDSHGDRNVLIFDLGGGTFDVSLLNIDAGGVENGIFHVKSTAGDTHLGGEDFDNNMTKYCFDEFKRKTEIDMSGDARARSRLLAACERAKRILSSSTSTTIEIDSFAPGQDFSISFSRAKFEELNLELFRKCIDPVVQALADAKIDKSKVHEVVLVGGSTRIPKVQQLLRDFFNGKVLNQSINPDEAVACGAAIQAAVLTGMYSSGKTKDFVLIDVIPLSLSIEVKGGITSTVIPRNSSIPIGMSKSYTTVEDNQTSVLFKIAEGERPLFPENHLLGEFVLRGVTAAAAGVPKLEATFEVDVNGILTVTAEEKSSQASNHIVIDQKRNRLAKEEIERMIADAERFAAADELALKRSLAFLDIENLCRNIQQARQDPAVSSELVDSTKRAIDQTVTSTLRWIEAERENPRNTQEIMAKKRAELELAFGPIIRIRPSVRPVARQYSGEPGTRRADGASSSGSAGKKADPKFKLDFD